MKERSQAAVAECNPFIERASQLPLNDAAYYLWRWRQEINRDKKVPPPPGYDLLIPTVDGSFRRAVDVWGLVEFDYNNAHRGPTFDRLKRAHPGTDDHELQRAIKLAVKFYRDCMRHFSYSADNDISDDVKKAMDLARKENPDFLDSTYDQARSLLRFMMR
jgi:hypothetical protein